MVAWLNVALTPCAMAFETGPETEQSHYHEQQQHEHENECPHCPPAGRTAAECPSPVKSTLVAHNGFVKLKDAPAEQPVAILQDRVHRGEHHQSTDAKRRLADVLRETKRFEESEQLYKEVIAMCIADFPAEHRLVSEIRSSLGASPAGAGPCGAFLARPGSIRTGLAHPARCGRTPQTAA